MNQRKEEKPQRFIRHVSQSLYLPYLPLLPCSYNPGSNLVAKVNSMDGPSSKPNNLPHPNPGGKAATFSTQGEVNLTGEYFQAQGSNGRSCVSCHIPEKAWSINPGTLQDLFDQTGELILYSIPSTLTTRA